MVIGVEQRSGTRAPLEFARAQDVPDAWWLPGGAVDPRRSKAWSTAFRWPDDGAAFLATGRGGMTFAAVRRVPAPGGWSRMNAVDVCAGRGRGVEQDPAVLAAAADAATRQLNLALAGYASPVWTADGAATPRTRHELATFIEDVSDAAAGEGARPAVLHVEHDSDLIPVLRGLGWQVGVTDLFAVLTGFGSCMDEYLEPLHGSRRIKIRRELRRPAEAGGRCEIVRGERLAPFLDDIAALEARSDHRHGIPADPARLRAMNERLLAAFGEDMAVTLVRDAGDAIVATCTLVTAGRRIMNRLVGFDENVARPLAGYFHAGYYQPLIYAWQIGATEILLGPGSLQPKLMRGAVLRPLYSAVPPGDAALGALLSRTDRALRARAAEHGFPVPIQ